MVYVDLALCNILLSAYLTRRDHQFGQHNFVYIVVMRDNIAQYKHTALYFRVLSVVDECYYLFYKQTVSLYP
jgi:hypothetical protein